MTKSASESAPGVGVERPVHQLELHRDPVAFNRIGEPARLRVRARDHEGTVESFVRELSRSRERMKDCEAGGGVRPR
jgi:hypothetical protein